ncbi:MAG: ArsA family ATPase [Myxococcales bacterium]|nr:ArsA family ATPase [Myxococcales bacterium]MCB9542582.1 ArsA family ATPase [Myxococcales bacterium]
MTAAFDDELRARRLLITAGAGGVGKTTTAAALAVRAAVLGQKTAVLTIDPARRLADALGLAELTGELRRVEPARFTDAGLADARGELWAMMLDVKTTGDQMVRRFAPDERTAREILDNSYYQYFSTSLAGAQEYVAVEQVRALLEEGDFDLVVLDTPPAAHALDFLDAPDRLLAGLQSKPVQMLRSGGEGDGLAARLARGGRGLVLKGINKLTGGPFIEELTRFLAVFGTILDALHASGEAVARRLRSDDSRFYLVTSPTRSNVDEAVSFRAQLGDRGFPLGGVIVNRAHPWIEPVTDDPATLAVALAADGLADVPDDRRRALAARMLALLDRHDRFAAADRDAVARLREATDRPVWTIPLFGTELRDLAGLHAIACALAPG